MPNWLTKATNRAPRELTESPQTFQLTCECSEQHSGQRKGRPQRIVCQSCGAALFVLPKNVYPTLKDRAGTSRKKRPTRKKGDVSGQARLAANEAASAIRGGIGRVTGGASDGVAATITGLRNFVVASLVSVCAFCTPFRLVVGAMAILLLATAGVAIRSRAHEQARQTFRTELEAGQASLADADIVAARDHFARAATAVTTLGTDDAQSRLVKQLHQETVAMTRLSPGSLFDVVDDAEKHQDQIGGLPWKDFFTSRYAGTWMVIQAPLRRTGTGFVVDIPYSVGTSNRQVIVKADLPVFEQLSEQDSAAGVIFAAPLLSCELNKAKDEWLVTLEANAGFLWSNPENLRAMGFFDSEWVDVDHVKSLLESQTRASGEGQ